MVYHLGLHGSDLGGMSANRAPLSTVCFWRESEPLELHNNPVVGKLVVDIIDCADEVEEELPFLREEGEIDASHVVRLEREFFELEGHWLIDGFEIRFNVRLQLRCNVVGCHACCTFLAQRRAALPL